MRKARSLRCRLGGNTSSLPLSALGFPTRTAQLPSAKLPLSRPAVEPADCGLLILSLSSFTLLVSGMESQPGESNQRTLLLTSGSHYDLPLTPAPGNIPSCACNRRSPGAVPHPCCCWAGSYNRYPSLATSTPSQTHFYSLH